MTQTILIVDDEQGIRNLVQGILEDEGYKTLQAENSTMAYKILNEQKVDLVILDIWLQGSEQDGFEILQAARAKYPHLPVLMISGHGTIETAVQSIQKGAYDFIEKPFKSERLLLMIHRALEASALKSENETLKEPFKKPKNIISHSPVMQSLIKNVQQIAPTKRSVFIAGQVGTGKATIAHYIHDISAFSLQEMVEVECSYEIGESELSDILDTVQDSSIYIKNPSKLKHDVQSFLAQRLQSQDHPYRIISSDINEKDIEPTLLSRLSVVRIEAPSLSRRQEDMEALCSYFLEKGSCDAVVEKASLELLKQYSWPGNVTELKNILERIILVHGADLKEIKIEHLPDDLSGGARAGEGADLASFMPYSLREAREIFEKEYLERQIERFGGNISKASEFIGMERSALHRKLKSLEIDTSGQKIKNSVSDEPKILQSAAK